MKLPRLVLLYLSFHTCIGFFACEEIEQRAIEDQVDLFAPSDRAQLSSRTIQFAWHEVDEADEYEFVLVEPSFDSVRQLMVRQRTDALDFSQTIPDGRYEWRVEAINSISTTLSEVRSLHVDLDSTRDLGQERIALVSPLDATVGPDRVELLWQSYPQAQLYRVEVATPSFANSSFIVFSDSTVSDGYLLDTLVDGEYRWRVQAVVDSRRTGFGESHFRVDATPPGLPTDCSPTDGANFSGQVQFSWARSPGASLDSLHVRRDSVNGELVLRMVQSTPTPDPFTLDPGFYFWQIGSSDEVGNFSGYTDWKGFEIR